MLDHPLFDALKQKAKWTVSDKNKRPLDLQAIIRKEGVWGAKTYDDESLGTYDELVTALPTHTNATYYYETLEDGYLFLDIEPSCPDVLKEKLLTLPYVYGETSMSGQGYHLLLPLPKNINKYPDTFVKKAIREQHGWYEILMNHYVTFTGNEIPLPEHPVNNTAKVFEFLAKNVKKSETTDFTAELVELDTIPDISLLLAHLDRKPFTKEFSDYGETEQKSRWEFAFMTYYAARLLNIARFLESPSEPYTDDMLLSILYHYVKEHLPYRIKHDGVRNNKPYLLWQCENALGYIEYHTENEA